MGLFGNLFGGGSPSMFGEGGIFAPPPAPQAQMPQSFSMPQTAQTGAQFGIDPATQQGINQAAAMPPQQTGPKFNEPGGWGDRLMGLSAALRDDPSVSTNYQNLQLERQKLAMMPKQAQMQAQLQAQLAMQQHQSDRLFDNANQPEDDIMRQMRASGIQPGSEQWNTLLQNHVANLSDPLINLSLGNDRFYSGPASRMAATLGGGGPAPMAAKPPPKIGDVVNNHRYVGGALNDRNSWQPIGGQTPPASDMFPIR